MVLNILNSTGFKPITEAIKNKHFAIAEALLLEAEKEIIEGITNNQYTSDEKLALNQAIEQCWKHIKYEKL